MKKFIIGADASEDEVKDTLGDLIETSAVIEHQLSDGIQLIEDGQELYRQVDEIQDIAKSLPAFIQQIKERSPELILEAVEAAEDRAKKRIESKKLGGITTIIVFALKNSASNYVYTRATLTKVEGIISEGKEQLALWKGFPDLV